jgi:hypothetical protein
VLGVKDSSGEIVPLCCLCFSLSAWLGLGAAGRLAHAATTGLSCGRRGRLIGRGSGCTATAKLSHLLPGIPTHKAKINVNRDENNFLYFIYKLLFSLFYVSLLVYIILVYNYKQFEFRSRLIY